MNEIQRSRLGGYFPFLPKDIPEPSEETSNYNCIAWALGRTDQWWQKYPRRGGRIWFDDVGADLAGWITVFERHGFSVCEDASLEPGYEKVAMYCKDGDTPKHVARQLPSGAWTSKLGDWEDIEHPSVDDLRGPWYGEASVILKRRRATSIDG